MMAGKRSMEDIMSVEFVVKLWNYHFPKFRMTSDDIQKPKPMFLIMVILEVFDALGLDTDGVIECPLEEVHDSECSESFRELLPVLNLTEALNTLFGCLSSQIPKVTPFHLLQPSVGPTLIYIRFLLNYVIFVREREEERSEAVRGVEEEVVRQETLLQELETLKDDMNQHLLEGANRDQRIKQLEDKIERMNIEPIEFAEMIDRLRSELRVSGELGTQLLDEQEALHKRQIDLQQENNRLRSCVVSKSEQEDVLRARECAELKDEEASRMKQEVNKHLWDREASIRTLTNNLTFIRDTQGELHALQTLYTKIQEVEKSNSGWCEGENELSEIRGNCEELQRRMEEIRAADRAWEMDNSQAEMEVTRELEATLREDKNTELEYEACLRETSEQRDLVEKWKLFTVQCNREREHLIHKYTKEIPYEYDIEIDAKIERIKKILNNTLKSKLSNKY